MTEQTPPSPPPIQGPDRASNDVQYRTMTVKTIRGREGATRTKWQNQGWEFVSQTQGTLRTELSFRKVKPKGVGSYAAQAYAAFRSLQPKTQKVTLGIVCGLVAILVLAGVIASVVGGESEAPNATKASATKSAAPNPATSEEPTAQSPTQEVRPYSYEGPKYEVVTVNEGAGMGKLDQHWVHTAKLDYSTDAYKEQIKLIVADVARGAGTAKVLVDVVTDKEIIQAESADTIGDFMDSHDQDYWKNVMVPKEASDWVASYVGGIDQDEGKLSDAESAFEITWFIAGNSPKFEKWKPEVTGSP
ncbi:hypothetical protein [Rhodococcus tukisamuensis]|uniref:Uncharacterized protein n=1 Tax=Rhodococcus tukisamuensis TaxID=168276 RepID=A0A1G6MMH0_9NOCA|nr:hypothetical protein [Rhodococcus tukisamuensis]SDC56671.1 hypothetical protein SAMN05444580_101235 [Rhodococcus tukisamuensis]